MDGLTSIQRRLLHAFTVLFGSHGAVTRRAAQDGQSRQALYRDTAKVVQAVDGSQTQARFEQLETRVTEQAAQLEQVTTQLQQSVQMTTEKQAEFAALAQAEGVSLPVARRLLAVVMGSEHTPSVATLGRHSAAAAQRAGQLLKVLDTEARKQVKQAAADEIFLARRRS